MACDNNITNDDIVEASANLTKLNTWMEGDASTSVIFGTETVPSPSKMINDARLYKASIDWSIGITISDANQAYKEDDVLYAPRPEFLPFVTGGTFDGTKWYPIQVILSNVQMLEKTTDILTGDYSGIANIQSSGYAIKNDGGGALWTATGTTTPGSAGTTDFANGVLFDSVGTEFQINLNGAVLIAKSMAVTGDGTTDDTNAINNCISFLTEGMVVFHDSDYRLTDDITIDKNNIGLIAPITATFIVDSGSTTTSGYAINYAITGGGIFPVNTKLENINVDISTNAGGNTGGINYLSSFSELHNVNIRIRGDNMFGLTVQGDDNGTGSYYNKFDRVFVQGDSTSGTPLTGTTGIKFLSGTVTPSRSPNANTFIGCRVGSCYDAYDIRGARNSFISCVSEAINQNHYNCDHPSVSSGCSRSLISNPYMENHATSTGFNCGTNSSACMMTLPFFTGVGTIFTDNSVSLNCRVVDVDNTTVVEQPQIRAAGKITGTTINAGYNVSSINNTGTGIYKVNFTNSFADTNYFVDAMAANSDLTARISVYNAAYCTLYFYNDSGAAANTTGFSIKIHKV